MISRIFLRKFLLELNHFNFLSNRNGVYKKIQKNLWNRMWIKDYQIQLQYSFYTNSLSMCDFTSFSSFVDISIRLQWYSIQVKVFQQKNSWNHSCIQNWNAPLIKDSAPMFHNIVAALLHWLALLWSRSQSNHDYHDDGAETSPSSSPWHPVYVQCIYGFFHNAGRGSSMQA